MKPKSPPIEAEKQFVLFKVEIEKLVDKSRLLVRLAHKIPWEDFNAAFDLSDE